MELGPGEPAAGPWRVEPLDTFARSLGSFVQSLDGTPAGRPHLIAVDGRGGSGKTVLAERLRQTLPTAAVIHSDDVAWGHARFGWDDLMITGVLEPLRAGRPVHFRPPGWDHDFREGHLDLPAHLSTVIIEGVGVSRRSLAPLLDALIWVQSDYVEAKHRGTRRDIAQWGRTEEEASRLWDEWEAEEVPFLEDDQPWHRAHIIVGTSTPLPHNPVTEVVVSSRPL